MVIAPAGAAAVVGILFRSLGLAAVLLAGAVFVVAQLIALAQSRRQLDVARRRLAAGRARRDQLRLQRRA